MGCSRVHAYLSNGIALYLVVLGWCHIASGADARELDSDCQLTIVESVAQGVILPFSPRPPPSTYFAWMQLIDGANISLQIAAYKSSLRGSTNAPYDCGPTPHGDAVYAALQRAAKERGVSIRLVENGQMDNDTHWENADGRALAAEGVLSRRLLDYGRLSLHGIMHSKFIVADHRHFYVGSANLDWRSIDQKMEVGVLARNCPTLANDLATIFETNWLAAGEAEASEPEISQGIGGEEKGEKSRMAAIEAAIQSRLPPVVLNAINPLVWNMPIDTRKVNVSSTAAISGKLGGQRCCGSIVSIQLTWPPLPRS